jgi:hypothetical protein
MADNVRSYRRSRRAAAARGGQSITMTGMNRREFALKKI